MSNTSDHKKAIAITASCRVNKGRLTDIYYKILEDQPSAIINAAIAIGVEKSKKNGPGGYVCADCNEHVDAVGIVGACIACDPRGFDGLY